MAYAPQGLVPSMEGPKPAPVAVDTSSARLHESSIRDRWTALVTPLAMLRFYWEFCRKTVRLATNRMD